ncbi:hypothetical protein KAR48_09175 [bacterium]|nr:hypothetical protein [bacterium]
MDNQSQNCKVHKDNPSVVFCKRCNSFICRSCIIELAGKKLCKLCYDQSIIKKYIKKNQIKKFEWKNCFKSISLDSNYCEFCGKLNVKKNRKAVRLKKDNSEDSKIIKVNKQYDRDLFFDFIKFILLFGIILFLLFTVLVQKISSITDYSAIAQILFCILAGVLTLGLCILMIRIKIRMKVALIAFIIALPFTYSVASYFESSRIKSIDKEFHLGLSHFKNGNWIIAKANFETIVKKTNNYKFAKSMLDSTNTIIAQIKSDSLMQISEQAMKNQEYFSALDNAYSASEITPYNNKIYDLYYQACTRIMPLAQQDYWKKDYDSSMKLANKSLEFLNKIKNKNYPNLSQKIRQAEKIAISSKSKKQEIEKSEMEKRQRRLTRAKAQEYANELASINEGKDMAVAFNLITAQGKREKIGWMLQMDLKSILEQFKYYGYHIRGGTKVELYDKILYQVDCFKDDNKNYFAYIKSNLACDRWLVTGVYYRGR